MRQKILLKKEYTISPAFCAGLRKTKALNFTQLFQLHWGVKTWTWILWHRFDRNSLPLEGVSFAVDIAVEYLAFPKTRTAEDGGSDFPSVPLPASRHLTEVHLLCLCCTEKMKHPETAQPDCRHIFREFVICYAQNSNDYQPFQVLESRCRLLHD